MERTSYSRKPPRARSSHIASSGQILGIILREKQEKSGVREEIGESVYDTGADQISPFINLGLDS